MSFNPAVTFNGQEPRAEQPNDVPALVGKGAGWYGKRFVKTFVPGPLAGAVGTIAAKTAMVTLGANAVVGTGGFVVGLALAPVVVPPVVKVISKVAEKVTEQCAKLAVEKGIEKYAEHTASVGA